jgi:hypothetical protein
MVITGEALVKSNLFFQGNRNMRLGCKFNNFQC